MHHDHHVTVYVGLSVDGFIARADGDVAWLERPEYAAGGAVGLGFAEFMARVDALVMGRGTYETVLAFPAWPYGDTPVVVLSSGRVDVPERLRQHVATDSGEPAAIVARQAAKGRRRLYVDGGVTAHRFLRAGLVDELVLTTVPVLLGNGRPLFGPLDADVHLELDGVAHGAGGMVQVRYRVRRD